jgi:hypothetical protein
VNPETAEVTFHNLPGGKYRVKQTEMPLDYKAIPYIQFKMNKAKIKKQFLTNDLWENTETGLKIQNPKA